MKLPCTKKLFVISTIERFIQTIWFLGCILLDYPFWVGSISLIYEPIIRIMVHFYILGRVVFGDVQFEGKKNS